MTKKLLEFSLSLFFLACTTALAVLIMNGKNISDSYVESQQIKANTINQLRTSIENISSSYLASLKEQEKMQEEIVSMARDINEVLYEAGIALSARALEKSGNMSPTDADNVINSSISNINDKSERLGVIAKALNDASQKHNK